MYYICIKNNVVSSFVSELDPVFPGIPIDARYSQEFLSSCIIRENIVGLYSGMLYDPETGAFSDPPVPEPVEPLPTPDLPPSDSERLRADVDFIAAMTGVAL